MIPLVILLLITSAEIGSSRGARLLDEPAAFSLAEGPLPLPVEQAPQSEEARKQLQLEFHALTKARKAFGGPFTLLSIGASMAIPGTVLAALSRGTSMFQAVVVVIVGAAFLIAGVGWLFGRIEDRRITDDRLRVLKARLSEGPAVPDPPGPPPPHQVMNAPVSLTLLARF